MTTLREAAQQALEALEQSWLNESDRNYEQEARAMNALRAALNAPPPEPVGWVYINRKTGERTFSRHMAGVVNHTEVVEVPVYAEPMANQAKTSGSPIQSEPVAWRTFDGEGGYEYRTYDDNENYRDEWDKRNPNHKGWVEPLYTHPPRREWQGLTEDEQRLCAQAMDAEPLAEGWSELGKFARAIEAALKEKNA